MMMFIRAWLGYFFLCLVLGIATVALGIYVLMGK